MCLSSIFSQEYPKNRVEVIIIDGGSFDKTLEIARRYSTKILSHPSLVEYGFQGCKNKGIKTARGDLIAFVDSDSELSSLDWLAFMTEPLIEDPEITASIAPILPKKGDTPINRYIAYGDFYNPATSYIERAYGIYSVYRLPKWLMRRRGNYSIFHIGTHIPISYQICSSGTLVRKSALEDVGGYDFDLETVSRMIKRGYDKFAYVDKTGVHHHHADKFFTFIRKKIRAAKMFLQHRSSGLRSEGFENRYLPSGKIKLARFLKGILYTVSFIIPLYDSAKMIKEHKDLALLYHPFACLATLIAVSLTLLTNSIGRRVIRRSARDPVNCGH